MKTALFIVALVCLSWGDASGRSAAEPADLILVGGTIYTLDPETPRVDAVAVSGQWIVYAGPREGSAAYRGPSTKVLHVDGLTVLPGLVDAHAHLRGLGNLLAEVDLTGTTSADDVRGLVFKRIEAAGPGEWIEGRGWDQNDWEAKEFPTWRELEGTESHPVCLRRVDGHAVWVNRRGLDLAGITKDTTDPSGGRIIRDLDGNPSGVLVDNAKDLVTDVIPDQSFDERVRRMKLAVRECQRYGLTGVHDAGVGEKGLEVLRYLDEREELGLRVYAMLDGDEAEFARKQIRQGPVESADHYLTVRALKLYADGALGSRGAALIEPYTDEPGQRGLFMHSKEELLEWTILALENGFQVCTHAIGDAANRMMLDVYEEALAETKVSDPRLRIEHAQVLTLEDIRRMGRLGVIASVQPTHATSDMAWAGDRLGSERLDGAYAWRKLIDAGCAFACGSDFPVEGVNPFWGIYAAVTRKDRQGWPEGGWRSQECMTMDEAVRGFSVDTAFASFAEHMKGLIKPNRLADLTILEGDPFLISPEQVVTSGIAHTIVGGAIVYTGPGRGSGEN